MRLLKFSLFWATIITLFQSVEFARADYVEGTCKGRDADNCQTCEIPRVTFNYFAYWQATPQYRCRGMKKGYIRIHFTGNLGPNTDLAPHQPWECGVLYWVTDAAQQSELSDLPLRHSNGHSTFEDNATSPHTDFWNGGDAIVGTHLFFIQYGTACIVSNTTITLTTTTNRPKPHKKARH